MPPTIRDSSSTFKAAPEISLYYETSSYSHTAATLLFLHGFGASTLDWADVRKSFENDWNVTLLDLKGHGRSTRPKDGDYSLDHQADLLLSFLEFSGPKPTAIIGHSYGGAVALLALARAHQQRRKIPVVALVLVDVPAYPQTIPFFLSVLYTPILRNIVSVLPPRVAVSYSLHKAFYDDRRLTPEIIDRYATVMAVPNSHYALGLAAKQLMPKDLTGYTRGIENLDVPTLIIWGDHDAIVPLSTGERLNSAIKGSVLKIVQNCGHVPQEECPQQFLEVVIPFLHRLHL